jgi:hypothetical protein
VRKNNNRVPYVPRRARHNNRLPMKVELKITADQVNYLAELFERYGKVTAAHLQTQPRESKVLISICIDIADKFADKFRTISRKQTIFDVKKKHKVSMKYYEAHAVSLLLVGCKNNEADPYRRSMAEKLVLIIDQQLV